MNDNIKDTKLDAAAPGQETPAAPEAPSTAATHRSPLLIIISALLALASWASLMWINGYVALAVGAAAVGAAAFGLKDRAPAWRNLGVTAIICATVLIVVVAAFLVVIKIGLS